MSAGFWQDATECAREVANDWAARAVKAEAEVKRLREVLELCRVPLGKAYAEDICTVTEKAERIRSAYIAVIQALAQEMEAGNNE